MNWYIGLDVGTTNLKAAAYCLETGQQTPCIRIPTPLCYTCEDRSNYELDVQALFEACCRLLEQTVAATPGRDIRALAVSSLGESGVLLDAQMQPLGRAIAWFDTRSQAQANALSQTLGQEEIFQITGQISSSKFGITKLMWMKDNFPALYSQARHWLSVNDYLLYRLTGRLVTDYSIASRTMAFDIRALDWSAPLLDAAQVEPGLFPRPVPGASAVGELLPELTGRLGLTRAPLVATGGHDHACAAVGAGTITPGTLLDSMGTSEVTLIPLAAPVTSHALFCTQTSVYPHCSDTLYRALTSMQACGASMVWFLQTIGHELEISSKQLGQDSFAYLQEIASACGECPGLFYYPFLRGCLRCPEAGGVFLGIRDHHGVAQFAKALLDGLCFEFTHQMRTSAQALGVELTTVRAVGGPSQSAYLMQRKADCAGLSVQVCAQQESASYGAALLAAVACGDCTFPEITRLAQAGRAAVYQGREASQLQVALAQYCSRRGAVEALFGP